MSPPSPSIGQTLGHYRIVEQIGVGGMGVVYRARDEHLERDVAIKVLPVGTLADEAARKRFRKEALALAKLNHPNIATIFEFSTQSGTDYLVTEYIAGLTLDHKLATGALSEKEVLTLGIQLAHGLSAAHARDIVHRDIKPANLRLTSDDRLKILDFGLAQLMPDASEVGMATTLTLYQEVIGTLPYMAPEQLRGEPADARTDIWAVGAVLYEMATAHRPFEGKVPTVLAGDIIHNAPRTPRSARPELSARLEAVILKCLEKESAKRYQSAHELQTDLERLSTGLNSVAAQRRWRWHWTVVAAIAIAAVLTMAGSWYGMRKRLAESANAPVRARRSVAVLGFKNLSGKPDADWLSTALSEMLTTELGAGEKLRTVSGEDVARAKIDLSLPDTDSLAKDSLARVRKYLGSDFVVLGSYLDMGKESGGQVRLDLRLQDATAGETIASVSKTGTEAQLLDLVSRTGSELREKLGVGRVTTADAGAVRASTPSDPEAARLYAEGLKTLRAFDALKARDLLEKAVGTEPKFPLSHSALAEVWSRLGYDQKAKDEAQKAFDLSQNLPREEHLSVEARYRESNHEWDKAIDLYRTLFNSFPDNLDYGLRLANAQTSAGQAKDAPATVERLRQLPAPQNEDPRIDLAEAQAAETLGDFKLEQQAAARAAQKGLAEGTRLVVAESRAREGWALERLGQPDKAAAAFAEAYDLYSKAGDRHGAAAALQLAGDMLYDHGDYTGARKNYEQALAVYRQIGAQRSIASAYNAVGNVLLDLGQLAAAESNYEQTLAIAREIGAKNTAAGALGNIANVLDNMGQLEEARKKQQEGLQAFREVGNKRGEGSTLSNLANLLAELGDLQSAKQGYNEALKIVDQTGYRRGRGYALQGLADVLLAQDQLEAASKIAEEARAIRRDLREDNNLAISNMQLALIRLEQGRLTEPEPLVRTAIDALERAKMTEINAAAYGVLTRILLTQGKLSDAQNAAQRALTFSQQTGSRPPRFDAALASARVKAATGKSKDALQNLQGVLAEATKFGYVPYEFEARLAMGEIEMQSGKASTGRAHLEALAKDARAKGFLLIARKATAAAKVSG
jgi:tetratricopeptide (TPR) repeat protein/tRNA A-37 threonylcarbamoyl transferase component Bud32/TolB-like protein